jgi:hypothetical protein
LVSGWRVAAVAGGAAATTETIKEATRVRASMAETGARARTRAGTRRGIGHLQDSRRAAAEGSGTPLISMLNRFMGSSGAVSTGPDDRE